MAMAVAVTVVVAVTLAGAGMGTGVGLGLGAGMEIEMGADACGKDEGLITGASCEGDLMEAGGEVVWIVGTGRCALGLSTLDSRGPRSRRGCGSVVEEVEALECGVPGLPVGLASGSTEGKDSAACGWLEPELWVELDIFRALTMDVAVTGTAAEVEFVEEAKLTLDEVDCCLSPRPGEAANGVKELLTLEKNFENTPSFSGSCGVPSKPKVVRVVTSSYCRSEEAIDSVVVISKKKKKRDQRAGSFLIYTHEQTM